ncbi:MAG: hypothetical protein QF682_08445 [Candidatus Thermoplasmatota archaeon]|jgi:hypothetical protein|nr:hypothetical protein [Candidatus Thermoplasmatota archaeon]
MNYSVRALPDQIRYGENGGILSGEVQNGIILIYHEYPKQLKIAPYSLLDLVTLPL